MAAKKKMNLLLMAVLLCAAALAAAGGETTTCNIPVDELKYCVEEMVQKTAQHNPGGSIPRTLFQPRCCNKLASQMGCGCLLRDIIRDYGGGVDLQMPFCPAGTACDQPPPPPY